MTEVRLIHASARSIPIADESVQCVVTSPPYWGLRQYAGEQRETWADGWYGALGLEPTPELYVEHMVEVFREVRRVLRADGTLWLNLGDSYAGSWGNQGRKPERGTQRPINGGMITPVLDGRYPSKGTNTGAVPPGLKPKDLVGIPWLVAFALRADGWYLRSEIIWHKPNPMPESVTDRPTKSHEQLFLMAKSERYYYDADAIREPISDPQSVIRHKDTGRGDQDYARASGMGRRPQRNSNSGLGGDIERGRNKRTVWTIATRPYKGAHFATFPPDLVEPCVLAGSSPKACGVCGAPWERVTERSRATFARGDDPSLETGRAGMNRERVGPSDRYVLAIPQREVAAMLATAARGREGEMRGRFGSKWDHWTRTDNSGARVPTFEDAGALRELLGVDIPFDGEPGGWRSTCEHEDDSGACVVLDPFNGSGTTGRVAVRLGRSYVGVDISKEYLDEQAVRRIYDVQMEAAL